MRGFHEKVVDETLTVSDDGLQLPSEFVGFGGGYTVRAGSTTIQVSGDAIAEVTRDGVLPLITPTHWNKATGDKIQNTEAVADGGYVGLMKHGRDASDHMYQTWYPIDIVDDRSRGDRR